MSSKQNASPSQLRNNSSGNSTSSAPAEINVLHPLSFLSTPAVIALIAYLILALVIILPFEIPVKDDNTGHIVVLKYNFAERLLVLLLLTLPIALSIYSINCMVVGNCDLLSYLIAFLTVIWVAIMVVCAFMYTFSR
jgi:hypothetical protein